MKNKLASNKGFTLIELLVIISLISILMGIAIPAISTIIYNSKRKTYILIAKKYIEAARQAITQNEFQITDLNTSYYIHFSNFEMETNNGLSPFAPFEDAYVVVTLNKKEKPYEYYWTSKDEAGYRTDVKSENVITYKDVYNNIKRPLNNKFPIGDRTKIIIIGPNKTITEALPVLELTEKEADKCYSYEKNEENETIKITYYNKSCGTKVNVPGTIGGYTVNSIYQYAFYNMGLDEVIIPNTIKEIGNRAFASNKITKVILPEGLTKIDSEAFMNNKIPEVYFPDGLQVIGARSFKTNKISSYEIPNSVSTLGACAFCDNPIPNPSFLYAKGDSSTIKGYIGDLSEFENKKFIIPTTKDGVPLKTIEASAFYSMGLSQWEVVIPDSVTTIKSNAFSQNGIAKINMPTSLKTIESSAFYNNNITELHIPNSVTSIGTLAFNRNKVTTGDIWIYKRTTSGIDYTTIIGYSGANRTDIAIPETVKTIDNSAFQYCYLKGGIIIPNNVTKIGELAFALNELSWVDNGDGDKTGPFVYKRKSSGGFDKSTLLQYAGYKTKNVIIPNNVKTIYKYAFYYSLINGVTIPEGVTTIGDNAFELCDLNGTVIIPSTVTSIGANAFKKQITWTSMNGNLNKIVNKTGRKFDWQSITAGPSPANFETGTIKNWYGDIEVTKN